MHPSSSQTCEVYTNRVFPSLRKTSSKACDIIWRSCHPFNLQVMNSSYTPPALWKPIFQSNLTFCSLPYIMAFCSLICPDHYHVLAGLQLRVTVLGGPATPSFSLPLFHVHLPQILPSSILSLVAEHGWRNEYAIPKSLALFTWPKVVASFPGHPQAVSSATTACPHHPALLLARILTHSFRNVFTFLSLIVPDPYVADNTDVINRRYLIFMKSSRKV